MALYKLNTRTTLTGSAHEVYVRAVGEREARAYALGRELRVESVETLGDDDAPLGAAVITVRPVDTDEDERSPGRARRTRRRRVLLVALGAGLGVLVVVGFLFVGKAKEHLGRRNITTGAIETTGPEAAPRTLRP